MVIAKVFQVNLQVGMAMVDFNAHSPHYRVGRAL